MLLLTLFAAFLPATLAVKCYTCSWSSKDAPNRTLMCRDEYFERNAIRTTDCENGCQTLIHSDSNGALEQVRRNCLQPEDEITGSCVVEENKVFTQKRCTCNYNLCNAASSLCASFIALALPVLFLRQHLI